MSYVDVDTLSQAIVAHRESAMHDQVVSGRWRLIGLAGFHTPHSRPHATAATDFRRAVRPAGPRDMQRSSQGMKWRVRSTLSDRKPALGELSWQCSWVSSV